jgi:NADPH:quinone reductase-like Zn-dependent oxidoreductase
LAELRISANLFGGVQLLALPACNTGMGHGTEVEGFGTLAQRQGAKVDVASLWPVAKDGRLLHIATTRGNDVNLDLRVVMANRLPITGSTLRSRSVAEKTQLRDGIEEHLWPLVQQGGVHPIVDQVFALDEAARAHERMESSQHIGKIVLKVA